MATKPKPTTVPDETQRAKFVRLGEARMTRVLRTIRLLGNLSTSAYEWSPADVDRMRLRIVGVLEQSLARFERRKATEVEQFQFEKGAQT